MSIVSPRSDWPDPHITYDTRDVICTVNGYCAQKIPGWVVLVVGFWIAIGAPGCVGIFWKLRAISGRNNAPREPAGRVLHYRRGNLTNGGSYLLDVLNRSRNSI